ncbi:hypothetical protein BOC42_00320 [Burkholderia pseudomallei]|nr:hypothetical protein BOC42_00320 [Burkholderia pseudomallei]
MSATFALFIFIILFHIGVVAVFIIAVFGALRLLGFLFLALFLFGFLGFFFILLFFLSFFRLFVVEIFHALGILVVRLAVALLALVVFGAFFDACCGKAEVMGERHRARELRELAHLCASLGRWFRSRSA